MRVIANVAVTTVFLMIMLFLTVKSINAHGISVFLVFFAFLFLSTFQYEFDYRLLKEIPETIFLEDNFLKARMLFGKTVRMNLTNINKIREIKSFWTTSGFPIYIIADAQQQRLRINSEINGYETLIRQILSVNPDCTIDAHLHNSIFGSDFYSYKTAATENESNMKVVANIVMSLVIVAGWIIIPMQNMLIIGSIVLIYSLSIGWMEWYVNLKYSAKELFVQGNVLHGRLLFKKETSMNMKNIDIIKELKSFGYQYSYPICIISSQDKNQIRINRNINKYNQLVAKILEQNPNCQIDEGLRPVQ